MIAAGAWLSHRDDARAVMQRATARHARRHQRHAERVVGGGIERTGEGEQHARRREKRERSGIGHVSLQLVWASRQRSSERNRACRTETRGMFQSVSAE